MRKMGGFCGLLIFAFLLAGCRENYLAEKEFYKANKVLKSIKTSDLKAKGVQAYEAPIAAFQNVVDKFPSTPKALESLFTIADLQFNERDLEASRQTLQEVIRNFPAFHSKTAQARFRIAQIYEFEGLWKEAEEAYWDTAEYEPLDQTGLYAPIQVNLHYIKAGDSLAQLGAYGRALGHYYKLLKQIGPIQPSAGVRSYVALTYSVNQQDSKAVEEWLSIFREFSQTPVAPFALVTAAETYSRNGDLGEAVKIYSTFLNTYPHHPLAAKMTIRLALLHHQKKEFAKEREWLNKVLDRYFTKDVDVLKRADVRFLIGKSCQDEGLWTEAERIYREIEHDYPKSPAALQIPFQVARHYKAEGQPEKAKSVLDDAIRRYVALGKGHPETQLERYVRRLVNLAYAKEGDWNQVLANLDEDMKLEKRVAQKGQTLLYKALITEKQLQDKKQALDLYRDFLAQYPNHPLTGIAKGHLEALTK